MVAKVGIRWRISVFLNGSPVNSFQHWADTRLQLMRTKLKVKAEGFASSKGMKFCPRYLAWSYLKSCFNA